MALSAFSWSKIRVEKFSIKTKIAEVLNSGDELKLDKGIKTRIFNAKGAKNPQSSQRRFCVYLCCYLTISSSSVK